MNLLAEGLELNNREISFLIWGGIALIAFSFKSEGRGALINVLAALVQPIIPVALGLATAWIGACVFLMEREGFWAWGNLKTTIVWAVTFAFVTTLDIEKVGKPGFTDRIVRDTINATALVVFVAEFATFNLLGELIFVPFFVVLSLLRAVAMVRFEHTPVRKLLDGVTVAVGLGLLAYSIWRIAAEFTEFAQRRTAVEFTVPILLSILFLPFIFAFGLWVTYQRVFSTFHYALPNEGLRRYARWRAVFAFGPDLDTLGRWSTQLVRTRPDTPDALDASIVAIQAAKRREKTPALVATEDGWSPYAAKAFLEAESLGTNAYQDLGDGEWSCSASLLDIGDGLMPNRLGYYLLGDELVVRRLRLKLYINNPALAAPAEDRFCQAAAVLLEKAGLPEQAALLDILSPDPGCDESETGTHIVSLTRENWIGGIPGGYERMLAVRVATYEAADN